MWLAADLGDCCFEELDVLLVGEVRSVGGGGEDFGQAEGDGDGAERTNPKRTYQVVAEPGDSAIDPM